MSSNHPLRRMAHDPPFTGDAQTYRVVAQPGSRTAAHRTRLTGLAA